MVIKSLTIFELLKNIYKTSILMFSQILGAERPLFLALVFSRAVLAEKFKTTMGEKGLFDTTESRAQLAALFNPLRELAVAQTAKDTGAGAGKPPPGDVATKTSFSIISMTDQWKKMQEGITKNKDEKEIKEATKKTATFTEKTAKGIEQLIANFGPSTDTGAPLFSPGY